MKILILTKGFYGGGTEVALNNLLNQLIKDEHDIKIRCINKRGPLLNNIPKEVKVEEIYLSSEKYRFFISGVKEKIINFRTFIWKIEKKIFEKKYKVTTQENYQYKEILKHTPKDEEKYDLLLDFHGYGYFLTAYGIEKVYAKKKVMWLHDENFDWMYKIEKYLKCFDKIFCVSHAVKDKFDRLYSPYINRTEVFYNLVDCQKIINLSQEVIRYKKNKDYLFLTVGRLEYQKGFDIAIEVANILKIKGISFEWLFIGDGNEYNHLNNLIQKNDLKNEVKLLGRLDNPFPYVKTCDLYIQPSRHEGFGLSVLEAKILNKPIIASNIGPFREQIRNEYNGILVDLNTLDFSNAIIELINNLTLQKTIINNLSNEKYDFSKGIEKLYNL